MLKAEQEFPDIDFHVMIADNWAPLKDTVLLRQLKKPVRVVLCGATEFMVNKDYLNLARQTGGSLHLMEHDLYNLARIHEGEIIRIGKKSFKLIDGRFVDLDVHRGRTKSL